MDTDEDTGAITNPKGSDVHNDDEGGEGEDFEDGEDDQDYEESGEGRIMQVSMVASIDPPP